ncbi:MAG TPA: hypothetical protein EYM87_00955, partial [Candidatus Marinimicrobia bacterium]|nr:hypothetical protein [Candidatus Neomarinimicrobiota bacterium]
YDLSAACSGFLFALETGVNLIESGRYNKVLVLGADTMTSILDYEDRGDSPDDYDINIICRNISLLKDLPGYVNTHVCCCLTTFYNSPFGNTCT